MSGKQNSKKLDQKDIDISNDFYFENIETSVDMIADVDKVTPKKDFIG